ncbi:hypothetical protein ACHAW6_000249, partial [Cyclotella cf. meneghiniana]
AGRPQITFRQKGLTARIITALGLDSSLSMRFSTPAEVGPLPKDIHGVMASGNVNYPAVIGMLLYLCGHSCPDIAFAVHQVAVDIQAYPPTCFGLHWQLSQGYQG